MLLPSLTASSLPNCFWNEPQTFPQVDKAPRGQGPACLLDLTSSLGPLPGLRDYGPFFQLLRTSRLFPPSGSSSYCPSAQTALLNSSLQSRHPAVSDSATVNRSTPGLPVHHQLPEFPQTHVHRVGDAVQPPHALCPLLLPPSIFPSIRSFQMSQFFASGGQSIGVSASASVLPMNIQD